jgi:hypothetical protein
VHVPVIVPHVFPLQVFVMQGLLGLGQSVAFTHCTQLPDPSHTPVEQEVPDG